MKRTVRLLLLSVTVVVIFVAGYAVGSLRVLRWMGGVQRAEVSGSLAMHVEALSRIRIGDTESAVRLLESQVDNAVGTLVVRQPWPLRSERDSLSLRTAKLYRDAYPDERAEHGVLEAYESISAEPVDLSFCSLALQELVRQAEARELEGTDESEEEGDEGNQSGETEQRERHP